MGTWSAEQQVCSTCRYWSGRREIDFTASFFNAKEQQGQCNGPDNSFRPMKTNEGSSCIAWDKYRNKK